MVELLKAKVNWQMSTTDVLKTKNSKAAYSVHDNFNSGIPWYLYMILIRKALASQTAVVLQCDLNYFMTESACVTCEKSLVYWSTAIITLQIN